MNTAGGKKKYRKERKSSCLHGAGSQKQQEGSSQEGSGGNGQSSLGASRENVTETLSDKPGV